MPETRPSGLDRFFADKGLVKASGRDRIWAYVRDQRPVGGGCRPLEPSIGLRRIGRREHVLGQPGLMQRYPQATVQRVMPSFTPPVPDGLPLVYASFLFGRTCAVTSTTSGHRQIRDRPRGRSTRSANSMTLSAISVASLLTSVTRHVKSSACEGEAFFTWSPSQQLLASRERAIGQAFPLGLNRREAFSLFLERRSRGHATIIQLNAPCDRLERRKELAVLRGPTRCRNTPAP